MSYALTLAAIAGWLLRRHISRWFLARLPDRTTRHRVVGAIIIAFAITFVVKLVSRFM